MRILQQPGPLGFPRVDMASGAVERISFDLRANVTLHEAVTGPMVAAGFQGGTVVVEGLALSPFRYVMPGPPDDASHVAYFTAPVAPAGITQLERANLTFGWADGAPFLHCHAVWIEPDGSRRGGHILPRETVLASCGSATAWGFRDVRVETAFDAETNFTLFGVKGALNTEAGAVMARIRPNEDVTLAVEALASTARVGRMRWSAAAWAPWSARRLRMGGSSKIRRPRFSSEAGQCGTGSAPWIWRWWI